VESNVLNNPNTDNNNEPGDIYTRVSEVVKKKVNEIADYNVRHKLLKLKIDRKLLKKPVMTVPYNVGMDTMLEQLIKDKFFEKKYESFCAADEIDNKINTYYIVSDVLLKEEYKEDKVILS
jgi:DNA-directed RNA polymerase